MVGSKKNTLYAVLVLVPSIFLLAVFVYGFIGNSFYISLTDYYQVPYSGISAVRQPGLPLIWIGFILICIGFTFPLMGTGPRVKTVIKKTGENSLSLTVSGAPGRIAVGFDDAFHTLVRNLKDTLC